MVTAMNSRISIVAPVFLCSESLAELTERIVNTMSKTRLTYEIVFVNDGSPDDAWQCIRELASKYHNVKGVCLSRNFGQHTAITTGLEMSKGDIVIVLDCDLQDQPEEIPKLLKVMEDGYDMVLGMRRNRHDPLIKRITSRLFFRTISYLVGSKIEPSVANFGAYKRTVVDAVCSMGDHMRSFPLLVNWVGFSRAYLDVDHAVRKYGKSSYSYRRLLEFAAGLIVGYSNRPLKLAVQYGALLSILSMAMAIITLYRYFIGGITVSGWTSVVISIWFLSGNTILVLGIIGLYVGQIFEITKNRPKYIIAEKINC
jgi:dolichol-phosphate mannosyltransferase